MYTDTTTNKCMKSIFKRNNTFLMSNEIPESTYKIFTCLNQL